MVRRLSPRCVVNLHSWAVPSLGVKIDACPGRINRINILSLREGKVYGQCSEICGVNHSFIPVVINFTSISKFQHWLIGPTLELILKSLK